MRKQSTVTNQHSTRINWRVNDFCTAHGICRTSFYAEVKRGEIKVIKYGKRTLIPNTEAEAWQARKEIATSK